MQVTTKYKPQVFASLVKATIKAPKDVRFLVHHLAEILNNAKKPLSLDTIHEELVKRDVVITSPMLELYLAFGVGEGFFKRLTSDTLISFALNKKARKSTKGKEMKSGFKRPNYGIGRSIINVLNKENVKKIFYAVDILKLLENDYPEATVRTIEAFLKLCVRKNPAQIDESNGYYLRKAPVTNPNSK